jgi:hypothetical protein
VVVCFACTPAGKEMGITDFVNPNDVAEKTVSEV